MGSIGVVIGATLVALLLVAGPSDAAPVPSFNESSGCGALSGVRGPHAAVPGHLPDSTPIYGPWGDFFGRTVGDVRDQLVSVRLPGIPGQYRTVVIHERVVPAIELVLDNLARAAGEDPEHVYRTNAAGSFSPATIPPHRRMSFHAIGAAIDINSHANPYRSDNELITDMPEWYVDAWRSAGWCWGGDWLRIKDTMHFSWMGPIHTPGYEMPPPQPALVDPAPYDDRYDLGIDFGVPAVTMASHHMADVDRDGAVDIVRIQPRQPMGMSLLVARARHGHTGGRLLAFTDTPLVDHLAPRLLVDVTADARPDLVLLDRAGDETLVLRVFQLVQGYRLEPSTIETTIPYAGSEVVLLDDVNLDGATDVLVIESGDPGWLVVWHGPDFGDSVGPIPLAVSGAGHHFATGDRDLDGHRDLFAIDGSGRLVVHHGPDFTSTTVTDTEIRLAADDAFFVTDLDGDGHPDIFVTGPDGATVMYRGGQSTHHPGVWYELTALERSPWRCADADGDLHGLPTAPNPRCRQPE